jgi:hypothetical protein
MRHELHLARVGFAALAVVAVFGAAAGVLVDGRTGALSALIGIGIIAVNHGLAVLSTAWARNLTVGVLAVGYSMFVVRMLIVLGTFGTLAPLEWINGALLATFFCAALVSSLAAECFSYTRGSYVPVWMRQPAQLAKEAR